jgi:multiple sugar transport system ATP-binding protein
MSSRGQIHISDITKRHGTVTALKGITLEIHPGEFFALLGPSGSGKSTTLRILAGLDTPSSGRVFIDGEDVTDVEPSERDVAMVFQSYALYPHMTVFQNIAFPLEMAKIRTGAIESAVREAARKVRIDHLLDRKPGQLSGGQQQRCALARAIVREPRIFLLDEPLSNLDAKLRLETRFELKKLQRSLGITAVYVTHDQEEAMTLADRMAIFVDGEIKQIGGPDEVFSHPNSLDVAGFIGNPPMNLIQVPYAQGQVEIAGMRLSTAFSGAGPHDVTVGIRPGAIRMHQEGFPAEVELIENLGDFALLDLKVGDSRIRARVNVDDVPREGAIVRVTVRKQDLHLFDTNSGQRLENAALT